MARCSLAALSRFYPLLLSFSVIHLLLHPSTAIAATCTGGGGGAGTYKTGLALPHLGAMLRYTYVPSTGALSLSFHAAPAAPAGWVAWGINPRDPRMLGTQALLAFRRPGDGSVGAATLNISTYYPVAPSPISYDVVGLAATDAGGGEMGLSATVRLPPGTVRVFQAWQVGPAVSAGGVPVGHYFGEDNLASVGVLDLMQGVMRRAGGG